MRINFILVLLQLILLNLNYHDAVEFKFTNFVCENYNESWVTLNECRLRAVSRNRTIMNFNATLRHSLNNIVIQAQMFRKANGYKPWLYKIEVDACRFLKKPYNPLAIIVFKLFKDFCNFNHTCPYEGPILVKGFYLRLSILPHNIPTGDYLVILKWVQHT
ncbi:uncharacterized protein LOC117566658 [Drosophila albomicans]|uniref:Uncharacterized protein LOC117566658 n=1 Tax=Drosophila albomicans TaxID=7291 RepID=A0A6P8WRX0_DROAB|nr:uncharacterized protein LOC117566658 [Drosophila albomicans]